MAETIKASGSMDIGLKDSGIVVDMSPGSMLQSNKIIPHALIELKECKLDEQAASDAGPLTGGGMFPTNLSTSPSNTTFRCERCDNFETSSRAALLLHVVQCLSESARLKMEKPELEDLSTGSSDQASGKVSTDSKLGSNTATNAVTDNGNGSSTNALPSSTLSSRKVFECDVCNMKFSNGANMRRHKMRHTGVKPYECRVCQKRFFRKDHLAEHFTTHTKTLPYHCPICNRGFQRQIAMRAHFQNEHVGQHDLVKTCPLCSYRAGSMKSLRIHFFNRHGIDLDNPGPGGTSSLLLALESQASQVAAAAAAAAFVPGLSAVAAPSVQANAVNHQNDHKDQHRTVENATPPMHYLTPHVEISTLPDNSIDIYNGVTPTASACGDAMDQRSSNDSDNAVDITSQHSQDHPLDCNAKSLSSNSGSIHVPMNTSPKSHHHETHIAPSISLIPIKQEPVGEDLTSDQSKGQKINVPAEHFNGGDSNESDYSSSNSRLNALIKVSPLKSLLREDLKRRICAKANNRINRNAPLLENNNVIQSSPTPISSTCTSTPICNGTITSTGQEAEVTLLNRKQILTCHFCGIEFPDETLYFLHKGCHCESNPWKCNICGEQCNNVYEFNSHLLSKSHQ